MHHRLALLITHVLAELAMPTVSVSITKPENSDYGDYSTNVAFLVAKASKSNPRDVAKQIVDSIEGHRQSSTDTTETSKPLNVILRAIDAVTIAGPGFINISLRNEAISTYIKSLLNKKDIVVEVQNEFTAFTTGNISLQERLAIEFTQPNPFKELHIGHVYNNALGESISRLLEFLGVTVHRINYQGDVGMHVAKAVYGMRERFRTEQQTLDALAKESPRAQASFLGKAYALGSQTYEENETAKQIIQTINMMCFIAAQERASAQGEGEATVDYRSILVSRGDLTIVPSTGGQVEQVSINHTDGTTTVLGMADITQLYLFGREWSLAAFEEQYQYLGTHFDAYYFESSAAERGYTVVNQHIADGIFERDEGAIVYRPPEPGLHTRVFINTLGLPTYEAKELGLAPTKYEDWPYTRSIIITAKEIDDYFRVLLSAMHRVFPEIAAKTVHLSHGVVRLPEGKMSSRTGNVVTALWLVDEVSRKIEKVLDNSAFSYDDEERSTIIHHATVAAIKYSLLKVGIPSDIKFDLDASVSFDGDSGPYLLYTYARCQSIIRKAKEANMSEQPVPAGGWVDSLSGPERSLLRALLYAPETIAQAASSYAPSTVAHYAIEVAQHINQFYAHTPVIPKEGQLGSSSIAESRLWLVKASSTVLKHCIELLGMTPIEKM